MKRQYPLSGLTCAAAVCALLSGASRVHADLVYTGVNLAGAEFGSRAKNVYGQHYIYPNNTEVDYYVSKGMNTFRVPFKWELMQPTLNGPLDAAELNRLKSFVDYATSRGAHVVLDPHNYARYDGTVIDSGDVTNAAFADFWSRLAAEFKGNDKVIFGLMNEPHGIQAGDFASGAARWANSAQQAINAIRAAGATNLIFVPGTSWSGAHSWSSSGNAAALLSITDPLDNYAFEVHQYLDDNSAGDDTGIVDVNIGVQRLIGFTQWLKDNGRRGFLGEFAVANSTIGDAPAQIGDEALENMLDYMEANDDVWLGWTWWAGGPWWGEYMFTPEPTNLGKPNQGPDRPVMSVLQPHLVGVPEPAAAALLGAGACVAFVGRCR